jgi:hypothetical protein
MSVHNFDTCNKNAAARWRLLKSSRAKHVFKRKLPLNSGVIVASTEVVYRPRSESDFLVHFDMKNIVIYSHGKIKF